MKTTKILKWKEIEQHNKSQRHKTNENKNIKMKQN